MTVLVGEFLRDSPLKRTGFPYTVGKQAKGCLLPLLAHGQRSKMRRKIPRAIQTVNGNGQIPELY